MNGGGNEKRSSECAALPKGWIREEVMRKGGLSAGKFDVYYYPPTGKKVRSKPELIKVLGDTFDLSCFDYSSGTMHSTLIKPRGKPRANKEKATSEHRLDVSNRFSQTGSLVPPIRQSASIFKQPVTVVKGHESKVKNDFKQPGQEKPRQLFWEKRLNGIAAKCAEEDNFPMNLPDSIKSINSVVGDSTTNILLASISTALHLGNFPVTGQVCQ
jgi:methyl-CpG-binding domain protein 2